MQQIYPGLSNIINVFTTLFIQTKNKKSVETNVTAL